MGVGPTQRFAAVLLREQAELLPELRFPIETTIAVFTLRIKAGDSTQAHTATEAHQHGRKPSELLGTVRVRLVPRLRIVTVAPATRCQSGPQCSPAIAPATLEVYVAAHDKASARNDNACKRPLVCRFFPIKTCPPSIKRSGWINRANPVWRANQIRRGGGGEYPVKPGP